MKKPYFFFFLLLFMVSEGQLLAQEDSTGLGKILKLSPQQMDTVIVEEESALLQTVSAASQKEESVIDAPGIVQVVTRKEILAFGYNDLSDILNRLTGAFVTGSTRLPNNLVSLRGDLTNDYSSGVLILVNGRPCRENIFGGVDMAVIQAFPVEDIERIEVIRGPGSSFYGINAFMGIINIVTITNEKGLAVASITRSTNNSGIVGLRQSYIRSRLNMNFAFRYHEQDDKTTEFKDAKQNLVNLANKSVNYGFLGNLTYGKWTFGSFWATNIQDIAVANPEGDSLSTSEIYSHRANYDLTYRSSFSPKWKYSVSNTFTYSKLRGNLFYEGNELEGYNNTLEMNNDIALRKNISLLAGIYGVGFKNYEVNLKPNEESLLEKEEGFEYFVGGYVQSDWVISKNIRLNPSLQWSLSKEFSVFTPRFTLIIDLSKNIGLKLNVASATKPISEFTERSHIYNHEDHDEHQAEHFKPESNNNVDLMLYLQTKKFYISADVFSNYHQGKVTYMLEEDEHSGEIEHYAFNNSDIVFLGLESEMKWQPQERILATVNLMTYKSIQYHFKDGSDEVEAVSNSSSAPSLMLKGGFLYDAFDKGMSMGFYGNFLSATHDNIYAQHDLVEKNSPLVRRKVNPESKGAFLLSANLRFDLKKIFRKWDLPDMSMGIYAENLLNHTYWQPDFFTRRINTVPWTGANRRAIYATFSIKVR